MTGFTKALGKIGHMNIRTYTQCATSTLRFQSASNNLIGLLTVGAVIGTGVTITDYVIEWRLGSNTGAIQLVTGIGSDPAIQAFHPIVSEPVVGGTLYAVIRYIVINGIRYSPYFRQGQYSPDLKTCLGSVTVVTMNCGNGTYSYWYSHNITYNNTLQPANNAERTLKFGLNNDGTSHYFAWEFNASAVADRITIYYVPINDENNPLLMSDWIIGSNATTNYTSNPRIHGSPYNSLKIVEDLTVFTHQSGDYLLIHITPRVIETSNTNTNWWFQCKCLASFNCYVGPSGCRTINPSTVTMEWVPGNCWWKLSWKNNADYAYPAADWSYMYYTQYSAGLGYDFGSTNRLWAYFRKQEQWPVAAFSYSNTCIAQTNSCRVQKVGANLTFTFLNSIDYNRYKNCYNSLVANGLWTEYLSDNTSYKHFKVFVIKLRVANSCGDAYTSYDLFCHHDSTFTFDDANYIINVAMVNTTNGITEVPCNTKYSQANWCITQVASWIASANFDVQTSIAYTLPIMAYVQVSGSIYDEVTKTDQSILYGVNNPTLLKGCIPADWITVNGTLATRLGYAKAEITNNADPANNFRLSTKLNDDGTLKAAYEIVYEKLNGVQIIP